MRNLYLGELRNSSKLLSKQNQTEYVKTIALLMNLNRIGQTEGLLALEEKVHELKEDESVRGITKKMYNHLSKMLLLIVDGTDPRDVEQMCLNRYSASNLEGEEAFLYLLLLEGALSIQEGTNEYLMQEKLLYMCPDWLCEMCEKYFKQDENDLFPDLFPNAIEEYCTKGERNIWYDKEEYPAIELLDEVFVHMTDKNMQRALREIDFSDLRLALKGLSENSRKRLFANMSTRVNKYIMRDIKTNGVIRLTYVMEAIQKILGIIYRLQQAWEFDGSVEGFLQAYADAYNKCISDEKLSNDDYKQILSILSEQKWV